MLERILGSNLPTSNPKDLAGYLYSQGYASTMKAAAKLVKSLKVFSVPVSLSTNAATAFDVYCRALGV